MMEFRLLRPDEIDCKVKQVAKWGVMLLLYKDARCDMNILDETVGPENWQRAHEVINDNLFCNVGIRFVRENGFGEWVWKQDVGTESMTEKEKGEASDAFKRACFNWGIGRELYTAPRMYVYADDLSKLEEDRGKWKCGDTFTVQDVQYIDRKICYVRIRNMKTKKEIEFGTPANIQKRQNDVSSQTISAEKVEAVLSLCKEKGVSPDDVCKRYGVSSITQMTEDMHKRAIKALQKSNGNDGQS